MTWLVPIAEAVRSFHRVGTEGMDSAGSQHCPSRDFPGGPVVKTLRFHCGGRGFDPWRGNWDPACRTVQPKKTKAKTAQAENRSCELVWPAAAPLLPAGRIQEGLATLDRRVLASVKDSAAPSSFLLPWAPHTGWLYPVGDPSISRDPGGSAGGPAL